MYRKRWDELNQCFSKTPLHDFASDFADAWRYLAIVANVQKKKAPQPHGSAQNMSGLASYNLEKLYTERERSKPKGIQKMRV